MGSSRAEERPQVGEVANRVRDEVEALLADATGRLDAREARGRARAARRSTSRCPAARLAAARPPPPGHAAPTEDIAAIFARLGFEVASGPEIELDWYNFEALNIPTDHPARDMQDTFYVDGVHARRRREPRRRVLLRTHTSPVQIRTMQRIASRRCAIICPGRVYRSRLRPDPLADVPPGRGALRRRGDHLRRPEGHARRVRARVLRPGHADPLPPELLPVRRARRRGRHLLLDLRRHGRRQDGSALRHVQGDRLARGARRRHGPPEGARERRHRPDAATPASPSAWASSAWRCSATASTTSGSSSRTTSASSSSSRPTMRISLKWLSEYVRPARAPEELARRLTAVGLEVEAIERTGAGARGRRRGAHRRVREAPERREALGDPRRRGRGRAAPDRLRREELRGRRRGAARHRRHDAARRHEDRAGEAPRRRVVGHALLRARARARRGRERAAHPRPRTSRRARPSPRRSGSRTCSSR